MTETDKMSRWLTRTEIRFLKASDLVESSRFQNLPACRARIQLAVMRSDCMKMLANIAAKDRAR